MGVSLLMAPHASHAMMLQTPSPIVLAQQANISRNTWDLHGAFANSPDGAYLNLMGPLLFANHMAYRGTPGGDRYDPFTADMSIPQKLSGGGTWERLKDIESTTRLMGPHMVAFVDRGARRAILAFRGTCFDLRFQGCQADLNYGQPGYPTKEEFYQMATKDVNDAAERLFGESPDYAILVTGHSLGSQWAVAAAQRSPHPLQVVIIENLPHADTPGPGPATPRDIYVLFDPIDLGIPADQESEPQLRGIYKYFFFGGSDWLPAGNMTLCIYEGVAPPPKSCDECAKFLMGLDKNMTLYSAFQHCRNDAPKGALVPYPQCRHDTHMLEHYLMDFLPAMSAGGSHKMPSCFTSHSLMSAASAL